MQVKISTGNSKIGTIPSISLPPGISCPPGIECLKACYANRHAYNPYPGVRRAWDHNWTVWQSDPDSYMSQVADYINTRKPNLFRWHIGGDIPSQSYLDGMISVARATEGTAHMAYTAHTILDIPSHLPRNLTIRQSIWAERLTPPPYADRLPVTLVIPKGATTPWYHCPGHCGPCGYRCWSKRTKTITITRH